MIKADVLTHPTVEVEPGGVSLSLISKVMLWKYGRTVDAAFIGAPGGGAPERRC